MPSTDYLNVNLKSLIAKVHGEGIAKANEKAQQIIAEAEQRASELLQETKLRIAKMEERSLNEIKHLRESLDGELKSAAQQTINSVKNELGNVISNRIVSKRIDVALSEKEFLQKIILIVLEKWNSISTDFRFELMLNKTDEEELRGFFEQRLKTELNFPVEVTINNKIKSGFKIVVKNENYYVNFSDEEFEKFFKSYLRTKTLEWIYGIEE